MWVTEGNCKTAEVPVLNKGSSLQYEVSVLQGKVKIEFCAMADEGLCL